MKTKRSPIPFTSSEHVAATRALRKAEAQLVLAEGKPGETEARRTLLHAQTWIGEAAATLLAPGMTRGARARGGSEGARFQVMRDLMRADLRVAQLEEALKWCGGSKDFAPGGTARKGWLEVRRLLGPVRVGSKP